MYTTLLSLNFSPSLTENYNSKSNSFHLRETNQVIISF